MAQDPRVIKRFTPSTINVGGVSTLTITITNLSVGDDPFNLVDVFPVGMVVAPVPNMINPFGGVVTGNLPGQGGLGNPLTITNGILPSLASLIFSIDVVSSIVGVHTNIVDVDFYDYIAQVQAQRDLTVIAPPPPIKRRTRKSGGVLCFQGVEGNTINYRGVNYQRLKDGECIFIPTRRK